MESSKITKLFGKNAETENNIFHEIAEAGALPLLHRIRDTLEEPIAPFLQEKNKEGNLCTHVVVTAHKGAKVIQLLKVLVELGADLNAINETTRFIILHLGVVSAAYELVEWLAQQPQIDLNIRGWDQLTAYEMAFIETDYRMMELLKAHGACGPEPEMVQDWSCCVNMDE